MPDFWSHNLAGRAVYALHTNNNTLEENLQLMKEIDFFCFIRLNQLLKNSEISDKFYQLGLQGPDIFYFIGKPTLFYPLRFDNFGNLLHDDNIKDQMRSLLRIAMHFQGKMSSYVKGYLIHYIFDVYCHPHIYERTEDLADHKDLEMKVDYFIISDLFKTTHKALLPTLQNISKEEAGDVLFPLWKIVAGDVYGLKYNCIQIKEGISRSGIDIHRAVKLTGMDFFDKLPFIQFFSKKIKFDLTKFKIPRNATKEECDYEEFLALYKKAFPVALALLKDYDMLLSKTRELEESGEKISIRKQTEKAVTKEEKTNKNDILENKVNKSSTEQVLVEDVSDKDLEKQEIIIQEEYDKLIESFIEKYITHDFSGNAL